MRPLRRALQLVGPQNTVRPHKYRKFTLMRCRTRPHSTHRVHLIAQYTVPTAFRFRVHAYSTAFILNELTFVFSFSHSHMMPAWGKQSGAEVFSSQRSPRGPLNAQWALILTTWSEYGTRLLHSPILKCEIDGHPFTIHPMRNQRVGAAQRAAAAGDSGGSSHISQCKKSAPITAASERARGLSFVEVSCSASLGTGSVSQRALHCPGRAMPMCAARAAVASGSRRCGRATGRLCSAIVANQRLRWSCRGCRARDDALAVAAALVVGYTRAGRS